LLLLGTVTSDLVQAALDKSLEYGSRFSLDLCRSALNAVPELERL